MCGQTLAEEHGQALSYEHLDVNEEHKVAALLRRNSIDLVVHFSGNAYVGESMVHPEDYYQNITASTVSLVRAMNSAGVERLIFSSSCATLSIASWPASNCAWRSLTARMHITRTGEHVV